MPQYDTVYVLFTLPSTMRDDPHKIDFAGWVSHKHAKTEAGSLDAAERQVVKSLESEGDLWLILRGEREYGYIEITDRTIRRRHKDVAPDFLNDVHFMAFDDGKFGVLLDFREASKIEVSNG